MYDSVNSLHLHTTITLTLVLGKTALDFHDPFWISHVADLLTYFDLFNLLRHHVGPAYTTNVKLGYSVLLHQINEFLRLSHYNLNK